MKTKFGIVLALTVVCLLPVVTGVSTSRAQPLDRQPIHQQAISNTVYLPIVVKPPCTYVTPTEYIAVSRPIVRVGDLVTVTGAIMNDCAIVGNPDGSLHTTPEELLSPSIIITDPFGGGLNYGTYREFTFTVQAVQAGVVSIVVGSSYETQLPNWPPWQWWWGYAESSPAVIRILP